MFQDGPASGTRRQTENRFVNLSGLDQPAGIGKFSEKPCIPYELVIIDSTLVYRSERAIIDLVHMA